MMYLITATILGFSLNKENVMAYTYLLPLAMILPSYLISVDYLERKLAEIRIGKYSVLVLKQLKKKKG